MAVTTIATVPASAAVPTTPTMRATATMSTGPDGDAYAKGKEKYREES